MPPDPSRESASIRAFLLPADRLEALLPGVDVDLLDPAIIPNHALYDRQADEIGRVGTCSLALVRHFEREPDQPPKTAMTRTEAISAAILILREGVVCKVVPIRQGGTVRTEAAKQRSSAGDESSPNDDNAGPKSRVTLLPSPSTSSENGASPSASACVDGPVAFVADLLSRPVTDFLAALQAAQTEANQLDNWTGSETREDRRADPYAWALGYEGASAAAAAAVPGQAGIQEEEEESARLSPTRSRSAGRRERASSSVSHLSVASSLRPRSPSPHPSPAPGAPLDAGSNPRPFDPADSTEDYSSEEHAAIAQWTAERLDEREAEFLRPEEISVWCGTFNVNGQQPKAGARDVQPWVDGCEGAELLVFAFQELDLSTEAMLRYTPHREDTWRTALEDALATRFPHLSYSKLHARQLVGALLLVYVRDDVRQQVSDVSSASLATGLMGVLANKGAVGIRLRYRGAPLTFVNSHLAAFVQNAAQRNAQFRDTADQLVFPYNDDSASSSTSGAAHKGLITTSREREEVWTPNLRPGAASRSDSAVPGWSVWDTEVLVWLGDLNYRLDLPRTEVERMLASPEQYDWLLRFDQLRVQQQHGLAFQGFHEAPITFPPTFKFDLGTNHYDTSDKQRVPSWTDRILYRGMRPDAVRAVDQYTSHPEVTLSDHKPVSALLRVSVYEVMQERRREIQREILAELNQYNSDALPDVKISPGPSIDVDEIRYGEPISRQIEVVNVGSVIAPWSFVIKPGTSTLTPPWLTLSPTSGLVLPASRQTVTLTLAVTAATSSDSLSFPKHADTNALSELLVLSVPSKDLFLSVSARFWTPTVFGCRLPHLVRLSGPIRETPLEQRVRIAQIVAAQEARTSGAPGGREEGLPVEDEQDVPRSAVPLVLHRLIGFLAEHALEVPDLFAVRGEEELVQLARECLDTGADFPLERFLPAAGRSEVVDGPSVQEEQHHHHSEVVDAVAALDALEADIGAVSLSSPALPPPRAASPPPTASQSAQPSALTDADADTDLAGLHALADCVLLFLDALADPVVPYNAYDSAMACQTRDEAYLVVRKLSEAHANTLLYIVAFLRVLLNQTQDPAQREARRDLLAVIFSTVLLRAPPASIAGGSSTTPTTSIDPSSVPRRKKAFVLMLLQDQDGVASGGVKVGQQ